METIFVSTHLIMLICIAGIVYVSISSKSNDPGEKKSDHQASISESLQAAAGAICRIAAVYLPIFIK